MWNRTYFAVETRHPVKGSRWNGEHIFKVSVWEGPEGSSYYASADNFGCGKNQATPDQAIYHLAHDNGAEIVRSSYLYEDEI